MLCLIGMSATSGIMTLSKHKRSTGKDNEKKCEWFTKVKKKFCTKVNSGHDMKRQKNL